MKKILFICAIISICSCKYEKPVNEKNESDKSNSQFFEEITEFTYKGHDYIRFSKYKGSINSSTGVVHNPECKKCINIYD